MNILAIVGTQRKNGLVSTLCQRILEGAGKNGHDTEIVNLYDYTIHYCIGCWSCATTGKCFQKDDFETVLGKIKEADVIVLGSPVYWSDVSAIMKTLFERCTGDVMYHPPHASTYHNLSKREKIEKMLSTARKFGAKEKYGDKKFILAVACTMPFPLSHISGEVPHTLYVMKRFVKKLKGNVIAKVVYTDTLFKFWDNKEEKMMKKAYKIGEDL